MKKPVIIAVDDEPEVLNSIERDLRQHYSDNYRVMKAPSGEQALAAVRGDRFGDDDARVVHEQVGEVLLP